MGWGVRGLAPVEVPSYSLFSLWEERKSTAKVSRSKKRKKTYNNNKNTKKHRCKPCSKTKEPSSMHPPPLFCSCVRPVFFSCFLFWRGSGGGNNQSVHRLLCDLRLCLVRDSQLLMLWNYSLTIVPSRSCCWGNKKMWIWMHPVAAEEVQFRTDSAGSGVPRQSERKKVRPESWREQGGK